MQNAHLDVQQRINPLLQQLAVRRGMPLVATGDVHYLKHEDARAHEALLCIQSGDSLKNPNHWKFDTDHFYFKTQDEMALDFPGQEDAMRRTLEIADRCNVEIELGRILLPKFADARRPRRVRLSRRALRAAASSAATTRSAAELQERLKFELKTIQRDGVRRLLPDRRRLHRLREARTASASARAAARPPARSSPTPSSITDIDPIRYDLLFERFLNPGRKSMPDIDIDFAVEGRERVINYVREKYGNDRVAQIITFGTMAARAAVRDAGRVLEVPYGVVDKIAKLIPEGPGQNLEEQPQARLRPEGVVRLRSGHARDRRPRAAARRV